MTQPILYSAPGEDYIKHIARCLDLFDIIFPLWEDTFKRIFSITCNDDIKNLLKEMITFHDLGKLTKRWQENLGTNKKLPSHTTIGAAYLYKRFTRDDGLGDLKNAIVFAVAIHHTDSGLLGDNIERPDVQAIIDGIVDNEGKIKWASGVENLSGEVSTKELNELVIEDLKNMARGLRTWARSGGIIDQHRKRIQASLAHHILKLCDISAATEREEYKKHKDENYYGGWLMCKNISEYVKNIRNHVASKQEEVSI